MWKSPPFLGTTFLTILALLLVYGEEKKSEKSKSPADYFPEGALIYAELHETAKLFESLPDSPLWWNISHHPLYQQVSQTSEFDWIRKSVRYVENNTGKTTPQILAKIFGKEAGFALYEKGGKPLWIFAARHEHPQLMKETVRSLVQLVFMAKNLPQMPQFEDYEGIAVLDLKKVVLTIGNSWLAVSPDKEMLQYFYSKAEWNKNVENLPLSHSNWHKEALKTRKPGALFGWVHYREMLTRMKKNKIFTTKTDQPLLTLLFGGLLQAIQSGDMLSLSGDIQEDGTFVLSAGYEYSSNSYQKEYQYLTPSEGTAREFVAPESNVLFSLEIHRDLGSWWENREVLHSEKLIPQFVGFNTIVGQLFGGVDVLEDLFGEIEPHLRLLGVRTDYDQGNPSPYLPSFVLAFRAKDADKFARAFRVGFQNGIGIVNFERAKDNKEVMLICSEKVNDTVITGARWLEPEDEATYKNIQFNFSPCLARQGDLFYLSTSIEALRLLMQQPLATTKLPSISDRFYLSGSQLHQILVQNYEMLIWNKMIEIGGDQERAKNEIQIFLDVVRQFIYAELTAHYEPNQFFLTLKTKIKLLEDLSSTK